MKETNEIKDGFQDINPEFFAAELSLIQKKGMPKTRYIKPPRCRELPERMMKYRKAEQLANDLIPEIGMRAFCIIDGTFIAGDFIEAFIVVHNLHVKRLTISTLSLSKNNVDSLRNLIAGNFVDELNLIVSDYFFSHERAKGRLVEYIYSELDVDDKFQLAAAASHCKISLIETHCGKKIIIHGSANLRSSSNIEQLVIEENAELYDFNYDVQAAIVEKYKTIKKSIRYEALWQTIN
jgi:hypothetical protein